MTTVRKTGLLAILILFSWTGAADAQYFGRNKVQYEKFDFQVLATEHFDIYYYPEEEAAVQLAARMAERWYARLSRLMRHELTERQPLILYAAHPHFQQTHALPGEISEGTGGVTEGLRRRIIMPFAGGLAETDHVLGHELVHAFQYDLAAQRNAEGEAVGPGLMALPLWFVEGMAEYLSLGPVDANTAMWVREATSRDAMPTVDRLDDPDFFPYRYGHAFWAYVAGRWGDEAVGTMLRATGPDGDIQGAMERVLGIDEETFNRDWHEATRRTYAPFFETTRPASAFAKPLITADGSGGTLNVSPALSPDGRRVVFLSERSLFSIDMYLADATTGRVIRKLVETAGDPHFDSLEFIGSAGDWSPDSQRFVFGALSKGQPVLSIVNADGGGDQEHMFEDLDQIFNPAWSPDGRRIVFSALKGGLLDLYLFSLEDQSLQQLTSDAFADLDPEWAPDGRSLVWVTDRFTSDRDTLVFGNYRIGIMQVPQGQGAATNIRLLAGFDDGRNSNPEFSADGRTLYFIGTPNGIPNIYRMSASGGGEPAAVTNLLSGVSGITPRTPALSVASGTDRMVFSVFENDNHNIYVTELATQSVMVGNGRDGAALPPFNRRTGDVAQLLGSPATGLPAPAEYTRNEYRARLGLEAVGQPVVGVGADNFGAYAAGGLSLLWGDMLGYHMLGTTVQLTSRFQEIGGVVAYLNRKNRINWGIVAEQTPYVTGSIGQGFTDVDGSTQFVQQTLRITQMNTAVSGVAHYPFSRVQRLEFSGGLQRIGFDQEVETLIFDPFTGQQIGREVDELPRPDPLHLGLASTALVYDSSLFGATSPILGQRYRLEYSQMAGDLLYSGVLADYRKYFMPARPFTIAIRGLHFGRYGRDGEDTRLSPVFLGSAGLVRGYEIDSFDANECVISAASTCESFNRLIGSRVAVVGAELRFPLLGVFSRRSLYGPLPIEVAFFGDAGTAWTSDVQPQGLGGDREWVRSVGAALRLNAFGYAILELDYVRPLDRPEKGWVWQFNLTPGF